MADDQTRRRINGVAEAVDMSLKDLFDKRIGFTLVTIVDDDLVAAGNLPRSLLIETLEAHLDRLKDELDEDD